MFEQKCEGCALCPLMQEEHLAGAGGTCRDPVVGMCLARVRGNEGLEQSMGVVGGENEGGKVARSQGWTSESDGGLREEQ